MIRAHMASYPARAEIMPQAVASIAPQVDHLSLILNQYDAAPKVLAAYSNLEIILPKHDLKDTGKFLPEAGPDDGVFLVDDDLIYAENYVEHTLASVEACPVDTAVFGYHGSSLKAGFRKKGFIRKAFNFKRPLDEDTIVDMLGTGTTYTLGRHLPPFSYMADAQLFTDIRFAKWCHEQGLMRICLHRGRGLIRELRVDESIFDNFTTQLPEHVFREVLSFGRKTPGNLLSVTAFLEQSGTLLRQDSDPS